MKLFIIAEQIEEQDLLALAMHYYSYSIVKVDSSEVLLNNWTHDAADAIILASVSWDLIKIVSALRNSTVIPLIVIANHLLEEERIEILGIGANAIYSRPYSMRLLASNVRSLVRLSAGLPFTATPVLSLKGMVVDPTFRTVSTQQDNAITLTNLEFRLLYALLLQKGKILSTESIMQNVWGYTGEGDVSLVRGLVKRVRAKIEPNPSQPTYILTASGGYYFNDSA